MNKLNRFGISLAVVSALSLGFTGCGSDSDDTPESMLPADTQNLPSENDAQDQASAEQVDEAKTVTVERGKVYGATVTDSTQPTNQTATQNNGTNTYSFENDIVYPVKVEGGFIDVDGDGQYSEGDLELDMELVSYEDKVTPISTYISKDENGNYVDNEANRDLKLQELVNQLDDSNATAQELLKVPSEATPKVQMATNAVYAEMRDENSTDINLGEISTRVAKFEAMSKEDDFQNLSSSEMAMKLEQALIKDPNMDGNFDDAMVTVTEADLQNSYTYSTNTTDNGDDENTDSTSTTTHDEANSEEGNNTTTIFEE
ncbi:MAG: hypothetical protein U9P38_06180 [Campylobacterota bacterium]|nr:hypothetical protein [Campylobacterota bacterium]